jgi:hypothetical protein
MRVCISGEFVFFIDDGKLSQLGEYAVEYWYALVDNERSKRPTETQRDVETLRAHIGWCEI